MNKRSNPLYNEVYSSIQSAQRSSYITVNKTVCSKNILRKWSVAVSRFT